MFVGFGGNLTEARCRQVVYRSAALNRSAWQSAPAGLTPASTAATANTTRERVHMEGSPFDGLDPGLSHARTSIGQQKGPTHGVTREGDAPQTSVARSIR